jgi:hypothetical protein
MKILRLYGFVFSNLLISFSFLLLPAQAGQLSNGKTFFNHPPLLLEASTTYKDVWVWAAKYYFTIFLPENAGEPLRQVVFQQKPSPEMIDFYPEKMIAFMGTRNERRQALNIQQSQWNSETNSMTITFDPPISPGTTVTVGLKPLRNPSVAGTYLFGVTVFPEGAIAQSMYLGVGRLHFYKNYW